MESTSSSQSLGGNSVDFADGRYGCFVLERLGLQRDLRNFCDVIIHTDDHEYPAHRNVLAACSPYLESTLSRTDKTVDHIDVSCGNHRVFETVLNYMYSGKITINKESVAEVLRLADYLVITKLKDHCADYLKRGLDVFSCFNIRDLAESNGLSALSKTVESFIFAHVVEIIEQNEVLELSESKLDFLISRSMPLVEIQRVKLICRWTQHLLRERKNRFPLLLTHILWQRVGALELCHFLRDDTFLAENEFCMYHVLQSLKDSCLLPDIYFDNLNTLRNKFAGPSLGSKSGTLDDNDEEDGTEEQIDPVRECDRMSVDSESTIIDVRNDSYAALSSELLPAFVSSVQPSGENVVKQDHTTVSKPSKVLLKTINKTVIEQRSENDTDKSSVISWQQKTSRQKISQKTPKQSKQKNENDSRSVGIINCENEKKFQEPCRRKNFKRISRPSTEEGKSIKTKHTRKARGSPRFACSLCPFKSLYPEKLEIHVKAAHRDGSKFSCSMCSYTCNWNREYYHHMKTHFPGPPHVCDRCGFSAERVQVLLVHQRNHTDERPYECKTCGVKFKMKNNLVSHLRCHSGEKPFICPVCSRSFATKGTLEQHMATHSNQRPYLCDLCGFSTKYQSHLIAHKRVHTGDVFKCQFMNCEYSTPKRSQLACHMRSHMRIRSFTCPTCGKSFVEKSHLVRHERVHLDDKPFKCDMCSYSSSRRDKLKEHQAKYHEESSTATKAYRPRKQKQQGSTQSTAKPAKAARPDKITKSTKVSKLVKLTDGSRSAADTGVMCATDVAAQRTAMSSDAEPGVGILLEAAVATDSQNVYTYQQGSLMPVHLNTYMGVVPLQSNGIATIQINTISPIQTNSAQHDMVHVGGQVSVISGNSQPVGQDSNGLSEHVSGQMHGIRNGRMVGLGDLSNGLVSMSNGHAIADDNQGNSQVSTVTCQAPGVGLSSGQENGHMVSNRILIRSRNINSNCPTNGHSSDISSNGLRNGDSPVHLSGTAPVQTNGLSSVQVARLASAPVDACFNFGEADDPLDDHISQRHASVSTSNMVAAAATAGAHLMIPMQGAFVPVSTVPDDSSVGIDTSRPLITDQQSDQPLDIGSFLSDMF